MINNNFFKGKNCNFLPAPDRGEFSFYLLLTAVEKELFIAIGTFWKFGLPGRYL